MFNKMMFLKRMKAHPIEELHNHPVTYSSNVLHKVVAANYLTVFRS